MRQKCQSLEGKSSHASRCLSGHPDPPPLSRLIEKMGPSPSETPTQVVLRTLPLVTGRQAVKLWRRPNCHGPGDLRQASLSLRPSPGRTSSSPLVGEGGRAKRGRMRICVVGQGADRLQRRFCVISALASTTSFLMTAMRMTLPSFPAFASLAANAARSGLKRLAERAAM
jgi:hypothetical protein